jgi:hypothetical protein
VLAGSRRWTAIGGTVPRTPSSRQALLQIRFTVVGKGDGDQRKGVLQGQLRMTYHVSGYSDQVLDFASLEVRPIPVGCCDQLSCHQSPPNSRKTSILARKTPLKNYFETKVQRRWIIK